ncbi:MAG: tyrosine-type recombinase/integrase [Chloroflexi bacterium]|nr:tyrosine-type recombinase/integrase [Chloroflexota bacterium]
MQTALARIPATNQAALARPSSKHPIMAYLAGLSPGSRTGQLTAICTAVAVMRYDRCLGDLDPEARKEIRDTAIWQFPWHELDHAHVMALRSRLQELYAYTNANKVLAVTRSLLKSCWRLGLIDNEEMSRAVDVPAVKGSAPPTGRDIDFAEMVLLMKAAADGTVSGVRDAGLFAVGYHCAPRIAEVANLKLADLDQSTGALTIRKGKGGKTRQVFLSGGALQAVSDWLEVRGDHDGPLFSKIRKDGQHNGAGISTWSIAKRLDRRRLQAGLEPLTWHDFRRTLAGDLIDDGDLAGAQLVLGHASPSVTMKYSRRNLKIVETVLGKRQTPYIRANGKT